MGAVLFIVHISWMGSEGEGGGLIDCLGAHNEAIRELFVVVCAANELQETSVRSCASSHIVDKATDDDDPAKP